MTRIRGIDIPKALIVLLAVLVPIVVARADTRPDAWITVKAKSALELAEGARASRVAVDTADGRVTLSGTVRSEADKARAAEDVRGVAGVVEVRNLLQVVTPVNRQRVRHSDEAVRADVAGALTADRTLGDSRITVRSVSNGIVLLGGIAADSSDNVRALRLAAGVPGVRRVYSEIDSLDAIAAAREPMDVGYPLATVATIPRAPFGASDVAIRLAVVTALDDLGFHDGADIRVRVEDGVVWLNGSVPTWQGNAARMHAVRSVTGVRTIMNGLRVVAPNADRR